MGDLAIHGEGIVTLLTGIFEKSFEYLEHSTVLFHGRQRPSPQAEERFF